MTHRRLKDLADVFEDRILQGLVRFHDYLLDGGFTVTNIRRVDESENQVYWSFSIEDEKENRVDLRVLLARSRDTCTGPLMMARLGFYQDNHEFSGMPLQGSLESDVEFPPDTSELGPRVDAFLANVKPSPHVLEIVGRLLKM